MKLTRELSKIRTFVARSFTFPSLTATSSLSTLTLFQRQMNYRIISHGSAGS